MYGLRLMVFLVELSVEQHMYSNFKAALCAVPENEIKEYFEKEIEKPIINQLAQTEEPAENLRQQVKQTKKILNILLTFRNK